MKGILKRNREMGDVLNAARTIYGEVLALFDHADEYFETEGGMSPRARSDPSTRIGHSLRSVPLHRYAYQVYMKEEDPGEAWAAVGVRFFWGEENRGPHIYGCRIEHDRVEGNIKKAGDFLADLVIDYDRKYVVKAEERTPEGVLRSTPSDKARKTWPWLRQISYFFRPLATIENREAVEKFIDVIVEMMEGNFASAAELQAHTDRGE